MSSIVDYLQKYVFRRVVLSLSDVAGKPLSYNVGMREDGFLFDSCFASLNQDFVVTLLLFICSINLCS